MDEEGEGFGRPFRSRRPSSSLISSTTSPLFPPAPRAASRPFRDPEDDVSPSSSTSTPAARRSINRSSSPLGSPDSSFWAGPYRGGGGGDPGTPGGTCVVSSSTADDVPASPFSPPEPQAPPIYPNPSPPTNNSVSVISGRLGPSNNTPLIPPPPPPSPPTPFNFSPSLAFNSQTSPLRSKIKKASSFERFSAQAQASSNKGNGGQGPGAEAPGPSRLMWDYGPRPNFVSSIAEPGPSAALPKPYHIKKHAAKIASERLEAEAAAAAAAASNIASSNNSISINGLEGQESLIRRQLSESPLNLTDPAPRPFQPAAAPKKIPLTPKQKLLHRVQSGELVLPTAPSPPLPSIPIQLQPLPPIPPPSLGPSPPPPALFQEPLDSGPSPSPPPAPDRYGPVGLAYEDFGGVGDPMAKAADGAGGGAQILYDPDAYNYYYGNILSDEIFNPGGQAGGSRILYQNGAGLTEDVAFQVQAQPNLNGAGQLEFVLGLGSPDEREELGLSGDDLSAHHQHHFQLDPNDLGKSAASDSTLRNLLMMDPLGRTHDESWISVTAAAAAAAADYQNRLNLNGARLPNLNSTNMVGAGSGANSWMNEWAAPPRNLLWQGQAQGQASGHLDREQDEVMDMSVMELEKTSNGKQRSVHQHGPPSIEEVDMVTERELMSLPIDLQQPLMAKTTAAQILNGKNLSPLHLQHHRLLLQYDPAEEPVNLMSAVNSMDPDLVDCGQEVVHHGPAGGRPDETSNSYANVCIAGSNIIFTTTSTSTTVAGTGGGGFEGPSPTFNLLPTSDNIDERRLIRVKRGKGDLDGDGVGEGGIASLIPDKPVQPKSFASLPSVLNLRRLAGNGWGVITHRNKKLPANARFGPVEGPLKRVYQEDLTNLNAVYPCLVMVDSSNIIWQLDRTDDDLCNWMKFVRRAQTPRQMNALISEQDGLLYFTTCKEIAAKTELQVGYGFDYAQKYGFSYVNWEPEAPAPSPPSPPPPPRKAKKGEKFLCFECDETFGLSSDLHRHLEIEHAESDLFRRPKKSAVRKYYNSLSASKTEKVKKQAAESTTLSSRRLLEREQERLREEEALGIGIVESSCSDQAEAERGPEAAVQLPPKVKCGLCYKTFATKERHEKHMMVHTDHHARPMKCEYCAKRFLTNSALAGHIKTHAEEGKCFECPICEFATQQLQVLKDHVQTHKSKETGFFTCPRCSKEFGVYSMVRKHIRAFHGPRHFGCEECPMKFPSVDKLRLHKLKHSSFRAYLCAECGKQFKRKDKLSDHTRKAHKNKRGGLGPLSLEPDEDDLDEVPKERESLKAPKVLPRLSPAELEKYTFRCLDCMVGFRRRGMLVNHMLNRHPDKELVQVPELNLPITRPAKHYFCPHCSRVYKSTSKRKAHILKNHPGKAVPPHLRVKDPPESKVGSSSERVGAEVIVGRKEAVVGNILGTYYGCDWCHRQYATRAKLLQHQRKHHVHLMPPEIQVPRTQKNNVGRQDSDLGLNPFDLEGVGSEADGGQGSEPNNSVISYLLTTTTVSRSQLGTLLQQQQPNPNNCGSIEIEPRDPGTITPHHNHHHHHRMISNGINVSGTQILTKTD